MQSGLEEEVLEGIITQDQVKEDIKSVINYIYKGEELSINTQSVKAKLEENINKEIEKNDKKVNAEEKNAINIYVSTITNIYGNGIALSESNIKDLHEIFAKIQNIINKIKPIVYIVTIVFIVVILVMNKKLSLYYLSIALIATGILLIVPKGFETIAINANNVLLLNQVLSSALIQIVENVLLKLVIWGIVFCIAGVGMEILESRKK